MKPTVLITGVAGGIGSATARAFSDAGYIVYGVDRNRRDDLRGVDTFIQADIADEADTRRIFAQVAADGGKLDVLVNNAAVQIAKPLVDTTPEEWDQVMNSNLRAVYLAIRQAHPLMVGEGRKGSIVNISSVHAVQTSANIAAYAASKGALLALTRALAIEFAPQNIRVNAVLPGAVDTHMLRAGLGRGHVGHGAVEEKLEALASRTVMGRIGHPDEIAQAIVFLADNERASFVTGQALVVDGGATARLSTE